MKEINVKLESEQQQMLASAEDFDTEIECSQLKQKMFQDQMSNLKKHIDEMEESVSRGILNLKELKE
eukprot:CAMPEP_0185570802 /NCGR_PEP_ID=MMETSP0434-20130131/2977_1 /TAXON_ID=626734 ORGANISM="Favella taraikaensis, Strain Fe Narragansett Bay" /NCGR_SAMPLE_ID=MMETSP0434 /ASSEMBLY_ACC=CAM_ASM_000379 /LENGTH=66 /DNA_ID=CAMNT_0028186007 /DNA_START=945 /DNA_END=1145 /DNA_ORIENTATION=-